MTTTRVVGIDPGLAGGVAFITGLTGEAVVMPTKPGAKSGRDVDAAALQMLLERWLPIDMVALEQVHAMSGQGVTSMFNFGKGYGKVLAVLEVMKLPILSVTPQRWKKSVLDSLGRDKNAAIRFAMNVFPNISLKATQRCQKPHDGLAESLCIAEYARREVLGFVNQIQKPVKRSKKLLAPNNVALGGNPAP